MSTSKKVAFTTDSPPAKSTPIIPARLRPMLMMRRRSTLVPGSFVMPPKPKPQKQFPEDDYEGEKGIVVKLPLLKTKEEWREMQEKEENPDQPPPPKPVPKKAVGFTVDDNVDATTHIQDILDNHVPSILDVSAQNHKYAREFANKLSSALKDDEAMLMYFRQRQFKGEKLSHLTQNSVDTFTLRMYIRAFLYNNEFQALTGLNSGIPNGRAAFVFSSELTNQQRKTVKQIWSKIVEKDRLQAHFFTILLTEAVYHIFKEQNEDLAVTSYTTDTNGNMVVTLTHGPVITLIASIPGSGLPRHVQLTHALPRHLPYCMEGKNLLSQLQTRIDDGEIMWFADAGRDAYWTLSFQPLMTQLTSQVNMVPRMMTYKDVIDVFHVFQSCNPALNIISPDLLENCLISVWKRPFQASQDVYEETIVLLCRKISMCLRSGKCPHLFYPSLNIIDTQNMDLQQAHEAADILEKIAKTLWIKPDKITDFLKTDEESSEDSEDSTSRNSQL